MASGRIVCVSSPASLLLNLTSCLASLGMLDDVSRNEVVWSTDLYELRLANMRP